MKPAIIIICLALLLVSCDSGEPVNYERGVYLLLDTSGTYTEELEKARQIINYLLSILESGDSFVVARIDSGSFSEKDIIAKVELDSRPSAAN
ncbi:MAG: VWA domain-containing protein, partial [Pseudomonadales bacterium]